MSDRIGRMDRRITIQALSLSVDGSGQPVETWGAVATVWAQVTPERGDERFQSMQIIGRAVTVFRIRYLSGIGPKHRIVYGGKNYDIHSVRELGRRERLEIDASVRAE